MTQELYQTLSTLLSFVCPRFRGPLLKCGDTARVP